LTKHTSSSFKGQAYWIAWPLEMGLITSSTLVTIYQSVLHNIS